ncbi:hypothetical protein [Nonomuraea sp. NPDC005692]
MLAALTAFVEAPTGSEDLRTFLLGTFRLSAFTSRRQPGKHRGDIVGE